MNYAEGKASGLVIIYRGGYPEDESRTLWDYQEDSLGGFVVYSSLLKFQEENKRDYQEYDPRGSSIRVILGNDRRRSMCLYGR